MENLDKLHTTEMGTARIKRNCRMETDDVVQWSKKQILDETANMERIGKNGYVVVQNYRITVRAHRYTSIPAHRVQSSSAESDPRILYTDRERYGVGSTKANRENEKRVFHSGMSKSVALWKALYMLTFSHTVVP